MRVSSWRKAILIIQLTNRETYEASISNVRKSACSPRGLSIRIPYIPISIWIFLIVVIMIVVIVVVIMIVVVVVMQSLNSLMHMLFQLLKCHFINGPAIDIDVIVFALKTIEMKTKITNRCIQPHHRLILIINGIMTLLDYKVGLLYQFRRDPIVNDIHNPTDRTATV